jgi:hypothetical protein
VYIYDIYVLLSLFFILDCTSIWFEIIIQINIWNEFYDNVKLLFFYHFPIGSDCLSKIQLTTLMVNALKDLICDMKIIKLFTWFRNMVWNKYHS